MLKNHKRTLVVTSGLILLPILAGLIFWNDLPARMVTHWGPDGRPNGWSSRGFAVFGLPAFLLAVHWLCVFFTLKDPKNKGQNPKLFALVLWITPVISLFVGGVTYAAALGLDINVSRVAMLLIGVVFILIGNYMPKCRQNHTIGIKIPWTLNDEENWNATHRFAGKVWFAGGLVVLASAFLPPLAQIGMFLPAIFLLVGLPVLYSYNFHKKHG